MEKPWADGLSFWNANRKFKMKFSMSKHFKSVWQISSNISLVGL